MQLADHMYNKHPKLCLQIVLPHRVVCECSFVNLAVRTPGRRRSCIPFPDGDAVVFKQIVVIPERHGRQRQPSIFNQRSNLSE